MNAEDIAACVDKMEMQATLCAEDYCQLHKWIQSGDADIRDRIAAMLAAHREEQAEKILLELARDDDELVRADAYDSLAVFQDERAADLLRWAAEFEEDELARYFALVSYVDAALAGGKSKETVRAFFVEMLEKAPPPLCGLACQYGLYCCGERAALQRILHYLAEPDYIVRCRAIRTLEEIVDDQNFHVIRAAVMRCCRDERNAVVKGYAESFLHELGQRPDVDTSI